MRNSFCTGVEEGLLCLWREVGKFDHGLFQLLNSAFRLSWQGRAHRGRLPKVKGEKTCVVGGFRVGAVLAIMGERREDNFAFIRQKAN